MKLCCLACLRKSHTHCRIGNCAWLSHTFVGGNRCLLPNCQNFYPAKANLSTHSFKKHFLGYLPTNTSCSCYTQKGFDQLIFAINYYVGVGYFLGSSFANQLRSSMGNYSKKSGPWEFPSEHWWCCSGYPTWTEQTQHSGLDWTQLSGQCPKVRVCSMTGDLIYRHWVSNWKVDF